MRVLTTYLITTAKYAYRDEDNLVYDRRRVKEEIGITTRQERYYLSILRREEYLKPIYKKCSEKVRVFYTYRSKVLSFFRNIIDAPMRVLGSDHRVLMRRKRYCEDALW